jgi:Flp pilus assembly pilin Flp
MSSILRQAARLALDEDGQDLIEYALLATVIALVGFAGMNAISGALNTAYFSWDTTNHAIWEVPPPQ